ncbi:MAG: RDD family protein [Polyangiaceae bacterium]
MRREDGREPIDTVVDIDTPERVRFACRLAGPSQRGAAFLVDLVIRGTIFAVLLILLGVFGVVGQGLFGLGTGLVLVVAFAVEWGYFVVCESVMQGQSVGKRMMSLRVIRADGLPVGFGDSVLRNLLRAADFLPNFYAIGALTMCLDSKFRRLGDLAAGTLVISERPDAVLPPIQLTPPARPKELAALPKQVPLSAEELEALELFLRRGRDLNPMREHELAELVAPLFAQRMNVRYRDPSRFLGLIYVRATGGASE